MDSSRKDWIVESSCPSVEVAKENSPGRERKEVYILSRREERVSWTRD
jgi:hypothetical protein